MFCAMQIFQIYYRSVKKCFWTIATLDRNISNIFSRYFFVYRFIYYILNIIKRHFWLRFNYSIAVVVIIFVKVMLFAVDSRLHPLYVSSTGQVAVSIAIVLSLIGLDSTSSSNPMLRERPELPESGHVTPRSFRTQLGVGFLGNNKNHQ